MPTYTGEEPYLAHLREDTFLPDGFSAGCRTIEFYPREKPSSGCYKMNMTLLRLDEPTDSFAAMFTRNLIPGHPVVIGRSFLERKKCCGVLINNRISNVACPGGKEDSLVLVDKISEIDGSRGFFFPSSTGIIGWNLPLQEMLSELPELHFSVKDGSALPLAQGIMTTDRFPKARTVRIGDGIITGVCKGAGMIEPHLATMLVFLMTDISFDRETLRSMLPEVCEESFNRISIDSDQSTSDSVFLFSSCKKMTVDPVLFKKALGELCLALAEDIVRNGEGTGHVIRVVVEGAPDKKHAVGMGKALVNSPLTKTAIYGNDPNVGRFLQAIGDYAGLHGCPLSPEKVVLKMGDELLFSGGAFSLDQDKESRLVQYLRTRAFNAEAKGYPESDSCVDIRIDLKEGASRAMVLGSDLSYEYIRENADYRT
jgi:glutamate N-acetyltransferase/amino-acid N-acetyltransferase